MTAEELRVRGKVVARCGEGAVMNGVIPRVRAKFLLRLDEAKFAGCGRGPGCS